MSRSRALAFTLLLVLPLAAGCLGGDDGAGTTQPAPDPPDGRDDDQSGAGSGGSGTGEQQRDRPPSPFLLRGAGCRETLGRFPVDAGQAQQAMPEGFRSVPFAQAPALPLDPGAGPATLLVQFIACPTGGIVGVQEQGFTLHLLSLATRPPEELRQGQALQDAVVIAGVTDHPGLAEAFQARGWTVAEGTANVTRSQPPGDLQAGSVDATGQGGQLDTTLQGSLSPAPGNRTPGYLRYWHAPEDRLEYLHVALTTPQARQNGTASLQAGPGSTTAAYANPASVGQLRGYGPYDLLASPVLVRLAGAS